MIKSFKFCPNCGHSIQAFDFRRMTCDNCDLVYYQNDGKDEGRICLFDSYSYSVEDIAKFHNFYKPYEVAITQNKVNSYIRYFE